METGLIVSPAVDAHNLCQSGFHKTLIFFVDIFTLSANLQYLMKGGVLILCYTEVNSAFLHYESQQASTPKTKTPLWVPRFYRLSVA